MKMKNQNDKGEPVQQNRELYDALDLRLALLDLNRQGFDLQVSTFDAQTLRLTCKRTGNRFVVECLGHNDWPVRCD